MNNDFFPQPTRYRRKLVHNSEIKRSTLPSCAVYFSTCIHHRTSKRISSIRIATKVVNHCVFPLPVGLRGQLKESAHALGSTVGCDSVQVAGCINCQSVLVRI